MPDNHQEQFNFDSDPLNLIHKELKRQRQAGEYSADAQSKGRSSEGGPFAFGVEEVPTGEIPKPSFMSAPKVEPVTPVKAKMPTVASPTQPLQMELPFAQATAHDDVKEVTIAPAPPSPKANAQPGSNTAFSGGPGMSTVNWTFAGNATAATQTTINQTHGTGAAHGLGTSILGTVGAGTMAGGTNILGNMQLSLTAIIDLLNKILGALQNVSGLGSGGVTAHKPVPNKKQGGGAGGFHLPPGWPIAAAVAAMVGADGSGAMNRTGHNLRQRAKMTENDVNYQQRRNNILRRRADKSRIRNGGPVEPPLTEKARRATEDLRLEGKARTARTMGRFGSAMQGGAYAYIAGDELFRGYSAYQAFSHGDTRGGFNNVVHGLSDAGQFAALSKSSTWGALAATGLEAGTTFSDIDMINHSNLTPAQKKEAILQREVRAGISTGELAGIAGLSLAKGIGGKTAVGAAIIGAGEIGFDAWRIHQIQNDPHASAADKAKAVHEVHNDMLKSGGTLGAIAAGAGVGALVGTLGGPVGTVIGGIAGGAIGAFAGEKGVEAFEKKIPHWDDAVGHAWNSFKNWTGKAANFEANFMTAGSSPTNALMQDIRQQRALQQPAANGQSPRSTGNQQQITITINNPVIKDVAGKQDIQDSLRNMLEHIFNSQYNNQAYSNVQPRNALDYGLGLPPLVPGL